MGGYSSDRVGTSINETQNQQCRIAVVVTVLVSALHINETLVIYLCASSRPTSPTRRTQWFLAWEPSTHFGEGETVETVQRAPRRRRQCSVAAEAVISGGRGCQ